MSSRRTGNDIHLSIPVSVSQATLGATLDVDTLEGEHKITIPAGTQPGEQDHAQEQGSSLTCAATAVVTRSSLFEVEIPRSLTNEQQQLFAALSESMGDEGVGSKGLFDKVKDVLTGD